MRVPEGLIRVPQSLRSSVGVIEITRKPAVSVKAGISRAQAALCQGTQMSGTYAFQYGAVAHA
jgi:hypothetical protein